MSDENIQSRLHNISRILREHTGRGDRSRSRDREEAAPDVVIVANDHDSSSSVTSDYGVECGGRGCHKRVMVHRRTPPMVLCTTCECQWRLDLVREDNNLAIGLCPRMSWERSPQTFRGIRWRPRFSASF